MTATLGWYVTITLLGWLVWPLAFRMLPGLPDRGYTLSRALGLLLVGYVFWLLGSLGFLQNTVGGIVLSVIIVMGITGWVYTSHTGANDPLHRWVTGHPRLLIAAELLFAAAFFGWALFRAYNPDIQHTEKPMELTFLNGVRNSDIFPPRDPWLSGYAISYYYFGYVLVASIAKLTSTASAVAFNLGIALLFALTLIGSYGLVYNLVAARRKTAGAPEEGVVLSSFVGPLLVGVMGNLGGLIELLYALNPRFIAPGFWTWLDIEDLNLAPQSQLWPPDTWRTWWWFRASRVITDRDPAGTAIGLQPIDEFPFFSFLLGDMHPHVLAVPFVLVALALAFNALNQRVSLSRSQLGLYTVCFGALAFLNTWDLPIYLFILAAVLAVRRIHEQGAFNIAHLARPAATGGGILLAGIVAYLPWYIGFRSQAGGLLPNALFPTRFQQFFVMFGPLLFVAVWFLVDRAFRQRRHMDWGLAALLGVGLLITLIVLMLALGLAAVRIDPGIRAFVATSVDPSLAQQPDRIVQERMPEIIRSVIMHRLTQPTTALALTGLIILAIAALLPRPSPVMAEPRTIHASNAFAIVLILTAAVLTLTPDFIYLRDVFGQRLNTIFKFYFAAWILLAIAASYAIHVLTSRGNIILRLAFAAISVALIAAGLIYPAFAILAKAERDAPTLNGLDYVALNHPEDYAGILWLQQNAPPGAVVLEAVGGQYSYYGRVSMATGLPTVLGWPGHEHQWRGELYAELVGTREQDVQEIYSTQNMRRAQELLARYEVKYIFVGSLERNPSYASPRSIAKFDRFLPAVFRDANITIYRADEPLIQDTP